MKLTTLKPRLNAAPARLAVLKPYQATVERKRGSAGVKDRAKIKERDMGLCQACLAADRTTIGQFVDHRTPLWAGGLDDDGNKWLLCKPCHDEKTAREAAERAGK